MGISYRQCPKCTFPKGIPILYGYPTLEAFQKAEEGKLKLGGCVVGFEEPEFYCPSCQHEWTKIEAHEAAYHAITGIRTSVGGYFQGFYEVSIDLVAAEVIWKMDREGQFETRFMDSDEIRWFRKELSFLNLLDWQQSYVEPGVLDGTSWSVDISRARRKTLTRSGSNQFPNEWNEFCLLIRAVTRREFR